MKKIKRLKRIYIYRLEQMIRRRNEEYIITIIPVLIHISLGIKNRRKVISEDVEETMKKQRNGRLEEDEVVEQIQKKKL